MCIRQVPICCFSKNSVLIEKGAVRFKNLYGFVEARKIYHILLFNVFPFIQRKINNWVIILGTEKNINNYLFT